MKSTPKSVSANEVGDWQKHTKGFGLKLLQKFGFKERLGANEDGISKAIEVKVRPTGLGDVSMLPTITTFSDERTACIYGRTWIW